MAEKNKHLEKAEKHLQKGKLENALDELLLARNDEPSNDAIVLSLAETYHLLNRPGDRRQCIAYLFDKYIEKSEELRAIEIFARLQKLGPVEPKRLMQAARMLERQKPEDAIQCYEKALATAGEHSPEMSLDCLDGLIRLQPNSLDRLQSAAELAAKLGRTDRAVGCYRKIADLLVGAQKFPEAAVALESAAQCRPGDSEIQLLLAQACSHAHMFPRLITVVEGSPALADSVEAASLLAPAYLASGQIEKAEAVYWKMTKEHPEAWDELGEIAVTHLKARDYSLALPLLRRLANEIPSNEINRLNLLAGKMSKLQLADIAAIELLAKLSERLHLDTPLAIAMHQLFDLYVANGEMNKATEALERLIDVDPYAPESLGKLQQLEGKTDPSRWHELASRLGQTVTRATPKQAVNPNVPPQKAPQPGGNLLGDLILQAEIFLQYNLLDKARERMERIARQYPGEETTNEDVRNLFDRIGFVPNFAPARNRPVVAKPVDKQADWGIISEVIRNLTNQSSVKGVLSSAVNDVGRFWQASRCVIGLATLNQPPTAALEYIAPGAKPSEAPLLGKLIMHLQKLTEAQGSSLIAERVGEVRQLQPLKALLGALRIDSLLAIPLREEDQPAGILILEQCGSERHWEQNDVAALQTIADQVVLTIANARLRSLLKTLAVTDERSGLLNRESYISCLLTEADRMKSQKVPLTATIMDFPEQPKGDTRVDMEQFMKQFQGAFTAHLRQSDIPLRYGRFSVAVILPGTTTAQANLLVEKMRKISANVYAAGGGEGVPPMVAGIAEAVLAQDMESPDIVTELINRVEAALEEARAMGSNVTRAIDPPAVQTL